MSGDPQPTRRIHLLSWLVITMSINIGINGFGRIGRCVCGGVAIGVGRESNDIPSRRMKPASYSWFPLFYGSKYPVSHDSVACSLFLFVLESTNRLFFKLAWSCACPKICPMSTLSLSMILLLVSM
jgi:hypothetical protein